MASWKDVGRERIRSGGDREGVAAGRVGDWFDRGRNGESELGWVLETFDEVNRELGWAESKEAIVDIAVETASRVLDLPLDGVWLYDESAEALVPASYTDADALPDEPRTFEPGDSPAWRVFDSGEPSVHGDLRDVERRDDDETPIRSEVIAPLGDRGLVFAGSTAPSEFDEGVVHLLGIGRRRW